MPSHRHTMAALLLAALQPVGEACSEPVEERALRASPVEPAAAERYYRLVTADRAAGPQPRFTLTTAARPPVAPGTTAWLSRTAAEPLAGSYLVPYAARKEVGFSYSSDGGVHAYMAAQDRGDAGVETAPGKTPCCGAYPAPVAPATYHAKGAEPRAVTSLLARLKSRGLKLALDDGWKLSAGARRREYSNAFLNSRVGHITLQRWWGDVSTAYSFQLEKRGGWNMAPSQSLQLGYALAPRSTVAVSYTAGRELAFFGNRGMVETEVRSLALQAEHAVEKHWSVRVDAGYYDHGALPSHRLLRFAFQRRLW